MSNLETNSESQPAQPITEKEIKQFSSELNGLSSPMLTIASEAMSKAVNAIESAGDKAIASQMGTPEDVRRLGDLLTNIEQSEPSVDSYGQQYILSQDKDSEQKTEDE
ncbi:MAG TPA: hypothetical protein VIM31_03680 [Candidatus Microsaccharimonas sp.]|jgi:hypothetical protein